MVALLVEANGNHLAPGVREHALSSVSPSAVAIVGATSIDRVQAARMGRNSDIPHAYFNSRESAREWLAGFARADN